MSDNRQILRLPAVLAMIGCSKPTIYKWVKKGIFPAPLKIGPKATGWLLCEIHAWIEQRSGARVVTTPPSQRAFQRRDARGILDGEFDELCGGYGVAPPRSAIAYPQRCAGAE